MAPERRIEFSVELTRTQTDRIFVAGRCYHGPLRVGDVFTEAYRYIRAESFADYVVPPPRCDDSVREFQLEVKSIFLYGRYLNQIDAGLTAELELTGDGAIPLATGDVMGGQSALPTFGEVEILGVAE